MGYLLSGKHEFGPWIVCIFFNLVSYHFAYKTIRVVADAKKALFTVLLTLSIVSLTIQNIFMSGSKPENFVLAGLMISTYLLIKEAYDDPDKKFESYSLKSMFVHGLLCGAIFMIKLNACLFYFAFIGCYLLWLLIRKKASVFFKSTCIFLAGIAVAALPIVGFLAATRSLSACYDFYIRYNIEYAGSKDSPLWLFKAGLTAPGKVSITILILLCVLAFVFDYLKKNLNRQKVVFALLSTIVFFASTYTLTITYFYIVFVPFYLYGIYSVASFILLFPKDEISKYQISIILSILITFSLVFQSFLSPPPGCGKKKEYERKLEEYAQAHPDASGMTLAELCLPGFFDYLPDSPDCRYFFLPLQYSSEMLMEQLQEINDHKADIIIFNDYANDPGRSSFCIGYLEEHGYVEYMKFESSGDMNLLSEEDTTPCMHIFVLAEGM